MTLVFFFVELRLYSNREKGSIDIVIIMINDNIYCICMLYKHVIYYIYYMLFIMYIYIYIL